MSGWYPPFEPHELDGMGELGKRVLATIELRAPAQILAELREENTELREQRDNLEKRISDLNRQLRTAKAKLEKISAEIDGVADGLET